MVIDVFKNLKSQILNNCTLEKKEGDYAYSESICLRILHYLIHNIVDRYIL